MAVKGKLALKERKFGLPVLLLSIIIPIGIACLYYMPHGNINMGFNPKTLPLVEAILNFTTFIFLLFSLYFIKKKNIKAHKACNLTAVVLSVLFLACYLIFHFTTKQAYYKGEGAIRYVYFFILITHIVLSSVIVPLVLITLIRGLKGNFERHKKIARYTWPLWAYVALSGVIVYIMMAPYYL